VAVLELIEVTQVFGSRENPTTALRAVSLQVEQREVVIIMGPSGSGKSTLLAIAGGLLHPTAGRVIVDDEEITGVGDRKLADVRLRKVGFVFQDFNLLDALSVIQNLELVAMRAGAGGTAAKHRGEALLVHLGLEHRMRYKTRQLSGGERQRVGIARALVNNPALILADEPTASLDGPRGAEVMGMLKMVAHDMGKAVVLVSHDHRTLDYADRVVWLQDGLLEDREPESMRPHMMPPH
jgi:putative ABC transport system ATP-binding protein